MSTSEKYISEALMKDKPKIPIGLFLRDKSVTTRKLANEAVTEEKLAENSVSTDKIKDHNVTWDKLTPEAQKVIEAGTGVDSDLVHDMEQWNNRIATLESAKLQPKTIIEATDVVEWTDNNTVIPVNISLQDEQGHIDDDSNYTDKQLLYSYQNSKETSTQGEVSFNVSFNNPDKVTIVANGYSKYKKVNVIFPSVTKTVYAVLPSYIDYVQDYNNWNNTGTKLVKHSLNGQYNVTNPYDLAYLVIAIPKNGMVSNISSIIQKGTLDAVQQYNVIDKGNYTLYVCNTKHNKGTYMFAVS